MKTLRVLLLSVFILAPEVFARPLVTEEVETVGLFTFEGGTSLSYRTDEFDSPTKNYETVNIPVHFKFGVHRKAEIGLDINYVNQKLEFEGSTLSGSSVSNFSPEFKISPWEFAGIKGIWHRAKKEDTDTELPIGHGNNYELLALFKIPFPVGTFHLNTGYEWRDSYNSQLGVRGGPLRKIEMGNIFENRASLEIPLARNFNLLSELAYYQVAEEKIDSQSIEGSDGEALDALAGITWAWKGWNIGSGLSFGLLDESHTSFDLDRGAGDWKFHMTAAYKLKPKRPDK